ncbi:solute carrier family 25 member 40-like [Dendronephthya gigantea]|uniref:solute carrier family 25 member 40-like n=1 Tax=Dendronephthya gigantea TaxID=151771 RepID=UPI00106BBCA4|nr:solute carrier family 25 member 40-like [Dendronephthya gigantea]
MEISASQQIISSCSGAILTSLLMTPFDVIKVRLQAQARSASGSTERCMICFNGLMDHVYFCPTGKYSVCPNANKNFTSTWDALVRIVRYEGVSALWGGLPAALVMSVPATIIYFTAYDQLKVMYGFKQGERNIYSPMLSGITARAIASSFVSPIEMLRVKLQSKKEFKYRELGSVVRTAVRQGGVRSLWQGLGPSLLRDIPFSALYWFGYEYLRAQQKDPSLQHICLSGGTSGAIAGILTLPFDVVKTHRQIELGESNFDPTKRYPSTFSLLLKLRKEQGTGALFTGITARVAKVAPACAIMITSYEYGKAFFRKRNEVATAKQIYG